MNAEKNRAKVKAWRLNNPEKYQAQEKARREKHSETRKAYMKIYRQRLALKAAAEARAKVEAIRKHRESLREFITRKAA